MYKIDIRRRAQRGLEKLSSNDFDAVIKAIANLSESPRPRGLEKINSTGLWRIRQGDYRIVYSLDDTQKLVIIVLVGHRREIYKLL
jgi:mRNA interferase RelE/StbE